MTEDNGCGLNITQEVEVQPQGFFGDREGKGEGGNDDVEIDIQGLSMISRLIYERLRSNLL